MSGLNKKSVAIALVILLLVVGLGFFLMNRGKSDTDEASNQEVFPTSDFEAPSPTTAESLSKEEIKIKVLNGSGVVGEANRVKLILEDNEFTVDSTGNADSYDSQDTTIASKSTVPSSIISELKDLLEKDYTVSTSSLDDSESVDIIITVGARINAPTSKPTAEVTEDASVSPTPTESPTPTSGT